MHTMAEKPLVILEVRYASLAGMPRIKRRSGETKPASSAFSMSSSGIGKRSGDEPEGPPV